MNQNDEIFDKQYKLFEDRFRRSQFAITQRLSVYVPLIAGVSSTSENSRKALDLGSGRGEWLALLSEHGWSVTGVEANSVSEATQDIDCEIIKADALDYLRSCRDHSFGLVTAFHIIEYLDTNYLLEMLEQIRRVLTSDGLVILETPNPENPAMNAWSFHLDPTNRYPIPPTLLQGHVARAGFTAPEIIRINVAPKEFVMGPISSTIFTLFCSGPYYVIVARGADNKDEVFAARITRLVAQISQRNLSGINALNELAKLSDRSIVEVRAVLEDKDRKLADKNRELASVYNSSSWRITRPLRTFTTTIRTLRSSLKYQSRVMIAQALKTLGRYPRLKSAAVAASRFIPPIERRLRRLAELRAPRTSMWSIDVNPQVLAEWTGIIKLSRLRKKVDDL